MMSDEENRVWVKIADDPLGNPVVDAISLGEHGVAFAGYAIDVPEDWLDRPDVNEKYFEIVDEKDVSDDERRAVEHNRARNLRFRMEAINNQKKRDEANRKAELAAGSDAAIDRLVQAKVEERLKIMGADVD